MTITINLNLNGIRGSIPLQVLKLTKTYSMKKETLRHIKNQVRPLIGLVQSYYALHNDDILLTLEVELHNICHDWEQCSGYSLEEDITRCKKRINFLSVLAKYEQQYHFLKYIVSQVKMIYDGNTMSEEYQMAA